MIGAFARMIGQHDRILSVEETSQGEYAVTSTGEGGAFDARPADPRDAPPAGFVEKISDEGGDVYVVPMLEALRQWVRRRIDGARAQPGVAGAQALTSVPEGMSREEGAGGTP